MKNKKLIIALCALAVSAAVAIISAFTLDAKKCKGHDPLRGDFVCGTGKNNCVTIVANGASVTCTGVRKYKDPLIIVDDDKDSNPSLGGN